MCINCKHERNIIITMQYKNNRFTLQSVLVKNIGISIIIQLVNINF